MIELQKAKELKRKHELHNKTKTVSSHIYKKSYFQRKTTTVFRKPVDIIKQNSELEKLKKNLLKADQILKNKLDKKAV